MAGGVASVPAGRWSLPLIVCTAYICLPGFFGLLSIVGLISGHTGPGRPGLIAGAIFGVVIGFPLAILQFFAVLRRRQTAAHAIAILFTLFSSMLAIGVVLGLANQDDDGLNTMGRWLFAICFLGANLWTSLFMWQYANSLPSE